MRERMHRRLFELLEPAAPGDRLSHAFDVFLVTLILLNVLAVMTETVKGLGTRYHTLFWDFEVFSVAIFTAEYASRVWTCTEDRRYRGAVRGRLRFALSPIAIADLIAILPFYIPVLIPLDLRYVRAVRLLRFFRLLKAARYSEASATLGHVLRSKKEELVVTLSAGLVLLVIASSLMWAFEAQAQPEKFGSIPAALWWGIVTLTTVGYGDIYPVTTAGKVVAGTISLVGIGLVALPAGILASGFVEHLQNRRGARAVCPHCGKEITQPVASATNGETEQADRADK